ncbi:MAG: type I-PGING CRISPR-associated protein Cas5p [Pyrinomonadaceae bacterium]
MKLDLSLLLEPPDFSARAMLIVDALAPLSMVTSMPGKYYRSQPEPTDAMLYGLLENALGWHISDSERKVLIKKLERKFGVKTMATGVGYANLLQLHVRFVVRSLPALLHFDDLWAQHLKGGSFLDGSRNYDKRVIPLMNAYRDRDKTGVTISDRANASKDSEKLNEFKNGEQIHVNVVRRYFPQYYASPTPREYVIPQGAYKYMIETSTELAQMLAAAFDNPAAPLYLGSNDGWVEAVWEVLS